MKHQPGRRSPDLSPAGVESQAATSLIARLAGVRVLVLGDLFLDEYLEGRTDRLSREAPVPVVDLTGRTTLPGGAANPARQVVAMGGRAILAGLIGGDEPGQALLAQLQAGGVDTSGIVMDGGRATTLKTRVVAYRDSLRFPQHLARIDRIDNKPVEPQTLTRLLDRVEVLAPQVDALLISDYRVGVLMPDMIEAAAGMAREAGILTAVDSQGNLERYRGFGLIKCNRAEAESAYGSALEDDVAFERALARLLPGLGTRMLVITRGPDGMSIQEQGRAPSHLPATNRSEVFDVTGAGDTVIAVLAMALAAGLSLRSAAHLANAAAGVVVRRLGNVAVTPAELAAELER